MHKVLASQCKPWAMKTFPVGCIHVEKALLANSGSGRTGSYIVSPPGIDVFDIKFSAMSRSKA